MEDAKVTKSMLELGKAVLSAQPFSQFLGAELVKFSEDQTEIHLKMRDEFLQQYGFAHGGLVSYLADNALTFAGGANLQGNVVTSEMKLNYIRPAKGTALIARASALSTGRTQAVVRCEIYSVDNGAERLCAAGQGTIVSLPAKNGP